MKWLAIGFAAVLVLIVGWQVSRNERGSEPPAPSAGQVAEASAPPAAVAAATPDPVAPAGGDRTPSPAGPAAAGAESRLAAGLAAFKAKRFDEALSDLQPLAETGDARAQGLLGHVYLMGRREYDVAERWFRLAAGQGDAEGQYGMAQITSDDEEAARWYRLAADHGHHLAQKRLGDLYMVGKGVPLDKPEAFKWFTLAQDGGLYTAQYPRRFLAGDMTPEEIAEGGRRVAAWHAELKDSP